MRKKERKLIITFSTTADAMAAEAACRELGGAGRLIPVPRAISAGCGLAWCGEIRQREVLLEMIRSTGVLEEAVQELEI